MMTTGHLYSKFNNLIRFSCVYRQLNQLYRYGTNVPKVRKAHPIELNWIEYFFCFSSLPTPIHELIWLLLDRAIWYYFIYRTFRFSSHPSSEHPQWLKNPFLCYTPYILFFALWVQETSLSDTTLDLIQELFPHTHTNQIQFIQAFSHGFHRKIQAKTFALQSSRLSHPVESFIR